jgi:hypothetical protein
MRHQVGARTICRRVSRIKAAKPMQHPIERSLASAGIRRVENIDQIIVRQNK